MTTSVTHRGCQKGTVDKDGNQPMNVNIVSNHMSVQCWCFSTLQLAHCTVYTGFCGVLQSSINKITMALVTESHQNQRPLPLKYENWCYISWSDVIFPQLSQFVEETIVQSTVLNMLVMTNGMEFVRITSETGVYLNKCNLHRSCCKQFSLLCTHHVSWW